MKSIGKAISVMIGGAFVGYLVKTINPYFITGTSAAENMYTWILPIAIFIMVIVLAIFVLIGRKKRVKY